MINNNKQLFTSIIFQENLKFLLNRNRTRFSNKFILKEK